MKTLTFIALAAMIFSSCSKDKDTPQPTVRQLLTSGKWYVEGRSLEGETYVEADECEKKTFYLFFPEGELITEFWSVGNGACNMTSNSAANWRLGADTELFLYSSGGNVIEVRIVEISADSLILINTSDDQYLHLDKTPGNGNLPQT